MVSIVIAAEFSGKGNRSTRAPWSPLLLISRALLVSRLSDIRKALSLRSIVVMPPLDCAHHEVKDHRGPASSAPGTDPDPTAGVHCAQMDGGREGVKGR